MATKRIRFLVAGLLLAVVSGNDTHASESARPMNVVFLLADDWRHDTLGCAGNPVVKTPRLDALARNGFRFTRACVTTSVCGVSRASLLTGQWMSRHGNEGFDMFKTPWANTFPDVLRSHGYWVGLVGKWHNGPIPVGKYDFARSYMGTHWMEGPDGKRVHVTQKNETDALEFLRSRPKDKPFCLTVSFFAAHAEDANPEQYLPQPSSANLYRDVAIPIPLTATEESFRRLPPFLRQPKNEGRIRWKWRFDEPDKYQKMMKNYYRLCTEVDTTCGRIIDTLKHEGVFDRTLIIFMGDNGYFHGEHGLADKWYPYDESIRVPLIVQDPRIPESLRGATNDDFVLNVDVAPTILAAANLPAP
jgi:arylsulfatase A-like enzyme